jgi:hypothetical protein
VVYFVERTKYCGKIKLIKLLHLSRAFSRELFPPHGQCNPRVERALVGYLGSGRGKDRRIPCHLAVTASGAEREEILRAAQVYEGIVAAARTPLWKIPWISKVVPGDIYRHERFFLDNATGAFKRKYILIRALPDGWGLVARLLTSLPHGRRVSPPCVGGPLELYLTDTLYR